MSQRPIIYVVDDEESFQVAIARLLRAAGYEVRTFHNAGDFLLAQFDDVPGCILLDICLPGPSGLELQKALATRPNPLPIIFLTGFGDVATSVQAIKAGAVDFLTKPVKREDLFNAIESALARDAERRAIGEKLRKWRVCFESLTERETEVFRRVVEGKMNKEIARELGTAERTVKAHRANMMEKMNAASIAELVHIADQLQAGLSHLPNNRHSA